MTDKLIVAPFEPCEDMIREYLESHGFSKDLYGPSAVRKRKSSHPSRLELALGTGTDRDEKSRICVESHRKVMEERGLTAADIIYAGMIGRLLTDYAQFSCGPGLFFMLYNPDMIEVMPNQPCYYDHSLYIAKQGFTFMDALIAVVSVEES